MSKSQPPGFLHLRPARAAVAVVAMLATLPACAAIPLIGRDGGRPTASAESSAGATAVAGVGSLKGVQPGVVRIVAKGTFADPEQGELLNVAGSGSGFVIDPTGIAVTNNHVVTGAALLEVYVDGEDKPRNARVLGVSECSDLAVIDIEGDGFTPLAWAPAVPEVGSEVYAAGYPLGESEFTLTKGIVSRDSAAGESSWASVDSVLLHDATINPGNSGGPLLDDQGRVVGVNYAGDSSTGQYFAISTDEALPLIDELKGEQDITSIGVNGEAFTLEDGTSGIWVASVESGSPAATTGVQGGDIITRLENLVLSTDGTMSDYCDVLRSHKPADVLAIEVVRTSTGEVLAGQVNGDKLALVQTFARELNGKVPAGSGAETTYGEYHQVSDDTGAITVEVPVEWSDVDGRGQTVQTGATWPAVQVSPDLNGFNNGFTTPGALVVASSDLAALEPDAVLDIFNGQVGTNCTATGRQPYDDGVYTGRYELYGSCGGTDTVLVLLAAKPADNSFMVIVGVQATTQRDLAALDRIIATFQVVGAV